MKITAKCSYHACRSDGLFFGIQLYFPASICDDNNPNITWKNVCVKFGFILFTLKINVDY